MKVESLYYWYFCQEREIFVKSSLLCQNRTAKQPLNYVEVTGTLSNVRVSETSLLSVWERN